MACPDNSQALQIGCYRLKPLPIILKAFIHNENKFISKQDILTKLTHNHLIIII